MIDINNIIDSNYMTKVDSAKKAVELINRAAELLSGVNVDLSTCLNESLLVTTIQTSIDNE